MKEGGLCRSRKMRREDVVLEVDLRPGLIQRRLLAHNRATLSGGPGQGCGSLAGEEHQSTGPVRTRAQARTMTTVCLWSSLCCCRAAAILCRWLEVVNFSWPSAQSQTWPPGSATSNLPIFWMPEPRRGTQNNRELQVLERYCGTTPAYREHGKGTIATRIYFPTVPPNCDEG